MSRSLLARLVLIGVLGGFLSGLFGIGGGILMVPLLVSLAGMDQRHAAATSLVAIFPASVAGGISYFSLGHVDLLAGVLVACGSVAGAFLGTALLKRIPVFWLTMMFVVLLLGVAVRMALPDTSASTSAHAVSWQEMLVLVLLGVFMGVLSGLFGIGGGTIAVPGLMLVAGVGSLAAKGTSLMIMMLTSAAGTFNNVRGHLADLKQGLVLGIAAVVASFPGVWSAVWLPTRLSNVLFAMLLVVSAVQLFIRALRRRAQGPTAA